MHFFDSWKSHWTLQGFKSEHSPAMGIKIKTNFRRYFVVPEYFLSWHFSYVLISIWCISKSFSLNDFFAFIANAKALRSFVFIVIIWNIVNCAHNRNVIWACWCHRSFWLSLDEFKPRQIWISSKWNSFGNENSVVVGWLRRASFAFLAITTLYDYVALEKSVAFNCFRLRWMFVLSAAKRVRFALWKTW